MRDKVVRDKVFYAHEVIYKVFARMNRVAEGFTREGGANIRTVQGLLGHKCIKTAMIYLHVKKDDSMVSPVDSL